MIKNYHDKSDDHIADNGNDIEEEEKHPPNSRATSPVLVRYQEEMERDKAPQLKNSRLLNLYISGLVTNATVVLEEEHEFDHEVEHDPERDDDQIMPIIENDEMV